MSQNPFFEDVRPVPHLHSPALSPDGGRLFFVYSGDIWSVSAGGGEAYQITSHVGYDRAPRFSPDGRQVVFESNRTGNGDLYVLDLESGDVRRLTHFGGGDALGDWSPDGAWLYFSSRRDGLSGGIFKVPVQGGTPIEVVCDPREAHSQPVLSPDGKTLALVNDGTPLWRKGPHPALASSIWTVSEAAGSTDYRRVTTYAGRNNNPMWAPDGKTIYFISDEGGTENIWAVGDDGSQRRPLTQFEEGRCLRASVSRDGRRIAFDRVGEIWLLDLESGEAGPVEIRVRADQKINPKTHRTFTNGLDEFSLSGDGKKVLFGVHGELFAAPSKGEEVYDAIRVTESSFREFMADWRPDSRAAVYLSDRFGNYELFEYDFVERAERQLTEDPEVQKYLPRYSPDGKWIAYLHGREEIRLIERETGTVRPFIHNALFTGVASSVSFAWAPDSQWIVFVARDQNFFNNLYVQRLDETEARQITFLSQVGTGAPLWSPNGKFIVFTTQQYRTQGQLARVDLTPVLPVFKEDEFEKLFEDEEDELEEGTPGDPEEQEEDEDEPQDAGASEVVNGGEDAEEKGVKQEGESIEIVFEGIKRRLQLLTPLEMNAAALAICPDGKALVFRSAVTGRDNLWHLLLEDAKQSEPPRQLTDTRGEKGRVCFTKDGKKIFYMDGGEIVGRDFPGGKTKKLRVRAELDVDFHVEKRQIFQEAWTLIRDHFYDPNFHGVNWEAVRDRYMPLAAGVQVQDDLLDILNLVVGELNGSHLGAGRSGAGVHDGYLGLTFGRVAQEAGRFEVVGVLPDGPCDVIAQPVVAGEVLTAIDGQMLNGGINFWERLQHKVGKKVRLTLELPGGETREADVRPVGAGAISDLAYRNWVYGNAAYVDRVSGGRLGYVHIRAMGLEDLHQFLIDLDTEAHSREGVLVDVRYNGGGHIATFILDVLAKRDFVRSSYRGKITTSSANLSGDRILNKPTVLLTNEHSGSNAEMFSEGYRRLGLGKVVGTPTMGAVIWTGTWKFLDGSSYRVPGIRVSTVDGENLEQIPRPVDIYVERPLGEAAEGKDSQLDRAVEVLLEDIGAQAGTK